MSLPEFLQKADRFGFNPRFQSWETKAGRQTNNGFNRFQTLSQTCKTVKTV